MDVYSKQKHCLSNIQIFINSSLHYLIQNFEVKNIAMLYTQNLRNSASKYNLQVSVKLTNKYVENYSSSEKIFIDTLNQHVQVKRILSRANYAPHVTKSLRQFIMSSLNLHINFLKTWTTELTENYKEKTSKQRNHFCGLCKKRMQNVLQ